MLIVAKLFRSQKFIIVQDLYYWQMLVYWNNNHYKFVVDAGAMKNNDKLNKISSVSAF